MISDQELSKGRLRETLIFVSSVGAVLAGLVFLASPAGTGKAGRLGFSPEKYPQSLRNAVRVARLDPQSEAAALGAAKALINVGRQRGEERLVVQADNLLKDWSGPNGSAAALKQAAIARQYLHDFDGSLELLDRSIIAGPSEIEPVFIRANIHLVLGDLEAASADCKRLASLGRFDLAILCDTTAKALGPDAETASKRLALLLKSGQMDPNLTGYAQSVMGEIAMFQSRPEQARDYFAAARDADPENLRIRMLQADNFLLLGEPQGAFDTLVGLPSTDAILVRRAIAARRLGGGAGFQRMSRELRRRVDAAIKAGSVGHAREQARFLLQVVDEPEAALERAMANWQVQKEYEDAWLLIEAAKAAGRPSKAEPVRNWMDAEGVTAPALESRLAEAAATP